MNISLLEKLENFCARLVSRIDADLQKPLVHALSGRVFSDGVPFSSTQHADATDTITAPEGKPTETPNVQHAPARVGSRYPAPSDCVPAA